MLKGTIYITYDINLCLANLNTCKTIIIADEPDLYNIPGKIGGSLLLPPYEALACIIDNDEERFQYEYTHYLLSDLTVNKFLNIILQALIAGTNIIFLIDKEGPKFDMVLKEFFMIYFGIIIGDESHQFIFDMNFVPKILNRLYADDDINVDYYLKMYPEEVLFDPWLIRKMAYDYNLPFIGDYVSMEYYKKRSKILKNGGLIRGVVKRL